MIVENRMYPLIGLVREPTQFPPQRVMEEWAMNCSALQYSDDPVECWKRHCENPLANHLRAQVIMRSVDSEFDHKFRGERTYLLCELQTNFEGADFTCPVPYNGPQCTEPSSISTSVNGSISRDGWRP